MKLTNYIVPGFVIGIIVLLAIQFKTLDSIKSLIGGNEELLNEYRLDNQLLQVEKELLVLDAYLKNGESQKGKEVLTQIHASMHRLRVSMEGMGAGSRIRAEEYLNRFRDLVVQKTILADKLSGLKGAEPTLADLTKSQQLTLQIIDYAHRLDTVGRNSLAQKIRKVDNGGKKLLGWNTGVIGLVLVLFTTMFAIVVNRIRKQHQLIDQLNMSEKKLKEAMLVKENFLANMSHEIRTPLNAILGYTALLQKKELNGEAGLHVETIHRSGETLLSLVNDILDLSKIESGMMKLETFAFRPRDVVATVVAMFGQRAEEKHLELVSQIHSAVPEVLNGDATRLTQILLNLVGNSLKFTEHGKVGVVLSGEESDARTYRLFVKVWDTGIGIEPEKIEGVFNRFSQAEDYVSRKYGGSGLGLSIVRDLVHLQHGVIHIDSVAGEGTEVIIEIPYEKGGVIVENAGERIEATTSVVDGRRALVVDDNALNRDLIGRMITQKGLFCEFAENGREALACLKLRHFDLVFMDIQMPEMDGYTATRLIRNELRSEVPVVAMTANVLNSERQKSREVGMNDYLSKPISEKELNRALLASLGNKVNNGAPVVSDDLHSFHFIQVDYLREISAGDLEFEERTIGQFLELFPAQLARLKVSFENNDDEGIRKTAHSLKSTISIMGLDELIRPKLDALESGELSNAEINTLIAEINEVTPGLMEESRLYLNSILEKIS